MMRLLRSTVAVTAALALASCAPIVGVDEWTTQKVDASSSSGSSSGDGGAGECAIRDDATQHCYFLTPQVDVDAREGSWSDSRDACTAAGADLVGISSQSEWGFLQLASLFEEEIWIGGQDFDGDGNYEWANGEPWFWGGSPVEPWAGQCVFVNYEVAFRYRECTFNFPRALCERVGSGR
jgi:hypothetical protein